MARHPRALGGPARETWAASWPAIEPAVQRVLARGEAVRSEETLVFIERHDLIEEAYLSFSYAPLHNAAGDVAGVMHTVRDQTYGVLTERRMRALQAVATRAMGAATAREVCERAAAALADFSADLPFALFYLLDGREHHATLAAATGLAPGSPAAPHVVHLVPEDVGGWPLLKAWFDAPTAGPGPWLVDDLPRRFARLTVPERAAAGTQPPERAVVLPLRSTAGHKPTGALVLALSPHRPFDARYRGFVDFVAQQVNAALGEALARQLERERMQRLAELDRAKTEFFSNISHEFRTPLTLLLAPLERFHAERDQLPPDLAEDVDAAARNARRLARLVDNLLDFSRGEGQRPALLIEPADLGALTADVASAFRSAIEAAGLSFRLDVEAGMPPVPVDRELWEGVVSNLLSNAFKFTFEGGIRVALRSLRLHAELEVTDTGVGIPKAELPHVFKRFHRVPGMRARTAEGSGVGLALVQDSVQLMGGQVSVQSLQGGGASFQVWLPLKSLRRSEAGAAGRPAGARSGLARQLAVEAERWTADASTGLPDEVVEELVGAAAPPPDGRRRQRVLVVDDNADIRAYLRRLLGQRWDIVLAADGAQALALARAAPPDAVLADVMIPGLDGFGLLKALRAEAATQRTPLLMLTARAGEQSAIQGLQAGADDLIAKPFSPRELVARLQAALDRGGVDAALRAKQAVLAAQKGAFQAAMNGQPLAAALAPLADAAAEQSGGECRCAFYIADAEGRGLHHVVGMPAAYAERVDGLAISPESIACGRAAAIGEPVLTADVFEEARWRDWLPLARDFDYRACWSFPLETAAGHLVGSMALYWRRPRLPTPAELELAAELTHSAAFIVSRDQAARGA